MGFWVEMRIDVQEVHATGDLPALGSLLGGPMGSGIWQVLQQTFTKGLPRRVNP